MNKKLSPRQILLITAVLAMLLIIYLTLEKQSDLLSEQNDLLKQLAPVTYCKPSGYELSQSPKALQPKENVLIFDKFIRPDRIHSLENTRVANSTKSPSIHININIINIYKDQRTESISNTEKFYTAGQTFDAAFDLSNILESAKKEIVLIDNYIDKNTLNFLKTESSSLIIKILTHPKSINEKFIAFINAFNTQFKNLEIRTTSNFHCRFLIIDAVRYYHIGPSLKDAGKKSSMISLVEAEGEKEKIKKDFDSQWNTSQTVS